MAVSNIADLVWAFTQTVGQGTYSQSGIKPGMKGLATLSNGQKYTYCCRDGVNYEIGRGTVSTSGTPSLTRDEILESSQANAAVTWGAGTRDLYVTVAASELVMKNRTQTWEADQNFNGNASFRPSGELVNVMDDNGAGEGPRHILDRNSASPAVNDLIGQTIYRGRSSTGVTVGYADILCSILTATNGAEDGRMTLRVKRAGSSVDAIDIQTNYAKMQTHTLTVGKSTGGGDVDTQGCELQKDGTIAANSGAAVSGYFGRSNDGVVLSIRRAGVQKGSLSVTSTGMTVNTFSGAHWSFANLPDDLPRGSVLCALPDAYDAPDTEADTLPLVRLSDRARDAAVYGLFGGYQTGRIDLPAGEFDRLLKRRPWLAEQVTGREMVPQPTPAEPLEVLRLRHVILYELGPDGAPATCPSTSPPARRFAACLTMRSSATGRCGWSRPLRWPTASAATSASSQATGSRKSPSRSTRQRR
jgi:hypothetical protein